MHFMGATPTQSASLSWIEGFGGRGALAGAEQEGGAEEQEIS